MEESLHEVESEAFKLYEHVPKHKYLMEVLQENDGLSFSLKEKIKKKSLAVLHRLAHSSTAELEFSANIRFDKSSKNFEAFKFMTLKFKYTAGVATRDKTFTKVPLSSSLLVYNPHVIPGFQIHSLPNPFVILLKRREVIKKKSSKGEKSTPNNGYDPTAACSKLERKRSIKQKNEDKIWNKPMPFNEKIKLCQDLTSVRLAYDSHSNLGRINIIKERYPTQARPYPNVVIKTKARQKQDTELQPIKNLYSRKYFVQKMDHDSRLADMALSNGGCLHLRGHNVKVLNGKMTVLDKSFIWERRSERSRKCQDGYNSCIVSEDILQMITRQCQIEKAKGIGSVLRTNTSADDGEDFVCEKTEETIPDTLENSPYNYNMQDGFRGEKRKCDETGEGLFANMQEAMPYRRDECWWNEDDYAVQPSLMDYNVSGPAEITGGQHNVEEVSGEVECDFFIPQQQQPSYMWQRYGDTRVTKSKHKRLSLPRQYNPAAVQPATAPVKQTRKVPPKPVNNEEIIDELLDSINIPDEIPDFPLFEVPENVLEFEEEQRKLEQEEHLTKDTLENLPNEESLKTDYCIKPDKNLSTDSGIAMMPESETKSSSKISESLMSFLNETGNDSDNDNEDKVENITNEDDLNSQQPQAVTSDDDEICKEMHLDTDDSVLNQDLDITEESLDSIDPPMKTDHDQYHEEEKSPTENEIDKDNGEKEVNHYDKINDVKSFLNISDISSIANLREMNYDAYDAHGADDDDVGSCKFSEDESDDDQKSSVQDELEKLDLSDDEDVWPEPVPAMDILPEKIIPVQQKIRVAKVGKGAPSTSELYRRKLNTKSSLMDDLFLSSDEDDDSKKNDLVKTTLAPVKVTAKKQIKSDSKAKVSTHTENVQNQKNKAVNGDRFEPPPVKKAKTINSNNQISTKQIEKNHLPQSKKENKADKSDLPVNVTKDEEQKSKCKKVFTASTPIRTRSCRVDVKIIKGLELTIKNYFINNPTKQLKKPKRVTFKEDLVSLRRIEDDTWNDALASPVEHMVATKEVKNDATVENVVEELFADCPTKSCNTKEDEKVIKFSKAVEINKACSSSNISTTKSDSRVNKTDKKNSKCDVCQRKVKLAEVKNHMARHIENGDNLDDFLYSKYREKNPELDIECDRCLRVVKHLSTHKKIHN